MSPGENDIAMDPSDVKHPPGYVPKAKRRMTLAAELSVAALAVICYATTLQNGYCHDDGPIVAANPQVLGVGPWHEIWTTDYWGGAGSIWEHRDLLYRPVAVTSYRVLHALLGDAAWPQHFLNIFLHALLAAMLVRLARRLTGDNRVAWIAGLLFAALAIHSEVVASVVGRADILASLGVVAAMLCHLRVMRSDRFRARFRWSVGVVTAVFVAMASKESGTVAPLCVFVADWFFHRQAAIRNAATGGWFSLATLRRLCYVAIPFAAYLALRLYALDGSIAQSAPLTKTINVLAGAPIWQRALGVVQLWGMYWVKTAWPQILNIDYSINAVRLATSVFNPHVLVGLVTSVALLAWAARRYRQGDPAVACLLALCVLCYLPTSNSLVLMRAFFAERVWYLPSVWVVMLVAVAVAPVVNVAVMRATLAVVLVAMVGRCWVRNGDWKNDRSLYAAAYRDHPNGAQALRLYGKTLAETADIEKGIVLLRRAIDIDLGYTDAYRDLGRALLTVGRYDDALSFLQTAEMQVPGHAPTIAALEQARRAVATSRADALAALRARVDEAPDDITANISLVQALRETADLRGAITHLKENQSRFERIAQWSRQYAITLVMLNDLDGAIAAYRRAAQLAPKDVASAVELAMLLLERNTTGDIDEAWKQVKRVEPYAANDVSLLVCRGELLAYNGNTKEAVEAYRRAIALEPEQSPRRNALIERLHTLGG